MSKSKTIAIVGANQTQFEHCRQCLESYHCVAIPAEKKGNDPMAMPQDLKLALVYSRKTQAETLDICNGIRKNPASSLTPMLLVADHFDVASVFIAKKAGYATVIVPPFENEELTDSMELLDELITTSA